MARVKLSTLLNRSKRNMGSGTNKVVKDAALEMIKRAYKEGINVQISEGHRSNKRQNELYAQGRTKGGNIVTNARAGQSWHNYGIAVDFFITTHDGKSATWTVNKDWRRVAAIGKSLGFEWGGDWTSFKDYPHLQMTGGLSLAQLQAGQRPKLKAKKGKSTPKKSGGSKKTASKTDNKAWTGQTLQVGTRGKAVTQLQQMLVKANFYPNKNAKNNGVDGIYGADTKNAVERYQKINLPKEVDGIAGKNTYKSLNSKGASKKSAPKKKSPAWRGATLKRGSKGAQVKQLQQMLSDKHFYPDKGAKNNGIDGIYGAKTEDAVRRFQSVNLPHEVDGIAGKNTYNKLK